MDLATLWVDFEQYVLMVVKLLSYVLLVAGIVALGERAFGRAQRRRRSHG